MGHWLTDKTGKNEIRYFLYYFYCAVWDCRFCAVRSMDYFNFLKITFMRNIIALVVIVALSPVALLLMGAKLFKL